MPGREFLNWVNEDGYTSSLNVGSIISRAGVLGCVRRKQARTGMHGFLLPDQVPYSPALPATVDCVPSAVSQIDLPFVKLFFAGCLFTAMRKRMQY